MINGRSECCIKKNQWGSEKPGDMNDTYEIIKCSESNEKQQQEESPEK